VGKKHNNHDGEPDSTILPRLPPEGIYQSTSLTRRFNGLTLLAYLNYTPRPRYTHGTQLLIAGPGL